MKTKTRCLQEGFLKVQGFIVFFLFWQCHVGWRNIYFLYYFYAKSLTQIRKSYIYYKNTLKHIYKHIGAGLRMKLHFV